MLEVGTAGSELEDGWIGDRLAPVQLQVREFGTSPSKKSDSLVGDLGTLGEQHLLDTGTRAGAALATKTTEHSADGTVAADALAREAHHSPQLRLPRQRLPSATDTRTRTQLGRVEPREDPKDDGVRKALEERRLAVRPLALLAGRERRGSPRARQLWPTRPRGRRPWTRRDQRMVALVQRRRRPAV